MTVLRPASTLAVSALLVVAGSAGAADRREELYSGKRAAVRGAFVWNADSIDVTSGRLVFAFSGKGLSWATYGGMRNGVGIRYRAVFRTFIECIDQTSGEAATALRKQRIVNLGRAAVYRRRSLPAVTISGPVGADCPGNSVLSEQPLATIRIDKLVGSRWVNVLYPLNRI